MIKAGAQLKPVFGGFETRLKFIKAGFSILSTLVLQLDLQYLGQFKILIVCF